MTRPDDAMEKVLAGLREVEAPVGMERRILERLENVAEVRSGVGWRAMWLGRPWLSVALGCGVVAAVIAVVTAIPAVHRRGPVSVRGSDAEAKVVAGREAVVENTRGSVEKKQVWGGVGSVSSKRQPEVGGAQGDEDVMAMSEMRAASFPAPPMPLTDEERLLLRMVHRGDPVELAMLDPKLEALRDAEEKADFQRFFAKPVAKEAEEQTTAAKGESTVQSTGDGATNGETKPASEQEERERQPTPHDETVEDGPPRGLW
jgi:hypothetical protein